MKNPSSTFGIWAAFLLPPVIQSFEWSWRSQVSDLSQKAARSIELLDSQALNYGEFQLSSDKKHFYRIRSENSKTLVETLPLDRMQKAPLSFQLSSLRSDELQSKNSWGLQLSHRLGSFELADAKLSFFPDGFSKPRLWVSPVGGSHWMSFLKNSEGAYLGLDPVENLVLTLSSSRDKVFLYKWDPESQLVRYFPCDATADVLIENVPEMGISRFSFWIGGKPQYFTIFDFSGSERKSEVTWAEALSCRDFIVGGSFGLSRVRY